MIVDYFYPDGWDGISKPHLYVRTRNATDGLTINTLSPEHPEYIAPHCWVPDYTPERRLARISARYPGALFHRDIKAVGNDGNTLFKLEVSNPSHLWEIKDELRTYEADISYPDQWLKHRYPDSRDYPLLEPRIWYFDMEWQPNEPYEGATTMIAIDDTHAEYPVVFAWNQDNENETVDFIDREGGYMLYMYTNEDDMHEAFLQHLDKCDPDMLIAHAIMWADLPQLVRRLGPKTDRLSPIGEVIRPRKDGYKETAQPILGRLCFDTAARWGTGTGLESLWQKSGNGQFKSRKLADIATDLKLTEEFGEQGEKMDADVRTWWVENFDEFVDYCVRDTTLLRRCTEKVNAIPFFTTMQKFCGVRFQSTHNVSNYIRGLIGRRTDLKGPSLFNRKREEMTAAHVPEPKAGRWAGVACIDFASMYPRIIVDANLCLTTKESKSGNGIRTVENGTHWNQEKTGVLPSLISEMMDLRKKYKRKMNEAEDEETKFKYNMLQLAVKVNSNACYGYVSQKAVGGGWIDPDIGATITYYGRRCINMLLSESEVLGYKALAGHTDSGYVQCPFNEVDDLVDKLNNKIQTTLNLPGMEIEFEAYFDYWTTADVKNRNFGIITWPESKKGTMKVTGFAYKASSVSPLTKEVSEILFRQVGTGAEEKEVTDAIRDISTSVLSGEWGIESLAPYGRIGKETYKNTPPLSVRAARYYNEHMDPIDPVRVGDSIRWLYVSESPENLPYTEVAAFRNPIELEGFSVDYGLIVDKFIKAKIKRVYDTLGWESLDKACGAKMPKSHW
tara:strand:- start:1874 stop:4237 length:2364 start_codon:yes stop_codon:yes gene_type:complete